MLRNNPYKYATALRAYRQEMRELPIDEKSDVWPMGANILALLTGLFPFHDVYDREEIEEIVYEGFKPHVDPRYRTRSYIEGRLVEIMERCFEVEPEERISIFEVVAHLRETKRVYIELHGGRWPVDPRNLVRMPADRVQPKLPEFHFGDHPYDAAEVDGDDEEHHDGEGNEEEGSEDGEEAEEEL